MTAPEGSKYRPVTRASPCPVCGKPDWCRASADGTLVLCNRVASGRPARGDGGGWLHWLSDAGAGNARPYRLTFPPPAVSHAAERPKLTTAEAELIDRQCRTGRTTARLDKLADRLAVSAASLRALGVGWHAALSAYTFPMRDALGRVIGIRTRHADGRKRCVPGSRQGLIVPADVLAFIGTPTTEPLDTLLVCEGESDAAAALDLGLYAIARPGCGTCAAFVIDTLTRLRPGRVVLTADADTPGQRGADALARQLARGGIGCDVLTLPDGVKDLRAWKLLPGTDCHALAALLDAPADRTKELP